MGLRNITPCMESSLFMFVSVVVRRDESGMKAL